MSERVLLSMRIRRLVVTAALFGATSLASCSEDVAALLSPEVVPAGSSDPTWADIGRSCTPSAPVRDLNVVQRVAAQAYIGRYGADIDNLWADVAERAPGGFGGKFRVGGRHKVYMQDTTDRGAKFRAMASVPELRGLPPDSTDLLPARWNYAQLFRWYRYLQSGAVEYVDGWWGRDLDAVANRLHFAVRDADSRAALEARLKALDLPCYLVAIEVRTPPSPFD